MKFCKFVDNSHPHISTNFCRFILIFHQMPLTFPWAPIVFTLSSIEYSPSKWRCGVSAFRMLISGEMQISGVVVNFRIHLVAVISVWQWKNYLNRTVFAKFMLKWKGSSFFLTHSVQLKAKSLQQDNKISSSVVDAKNCDKVQHLPLQIDSGFFTPWHSLKYVTEICFGGHL